MLALIVGGGCVVYALRRVPQRYTRTTRVLVFLGLIQQGGTASTERRLMKKLRHAEFVYGTPPCSTHCGRSPCHDALSFAHSDESVAPLGIHLQHLVCLPLRPPEARKSLQRAVTLILNPSLDVLLGYGVGHHPRWNRILVAASLLCVLAASGDVQAST